MKDYHDASITRRQMRFRKKTYNVKNIDVYKIDITIKYHQILKINLKNTCTINFLFQKYIDSDRRCSNSKDRFCMLAIAALFIA